MARGNPVPWFACFATRYLTFEVNRMEEALMAINLNLEEIIKQLHRIADCMEGMDVEATARELKQISKNWEMGAYTK
jgi:hypothetical protein